jgi:hypothetical protein
MRRSARIRSMSAPRPESIVFDVGQVLVEVEPRALLAYLGGGATGCDDLEPARTLFVDDRAANIVAASARGWRGIVHRTPAATEAWLAGCGVQVPC